jgi:hypothetical protein
MQEIDWHRTYSVLQQIVGYKVKVDGEHDGIIRGIFGGPLELFFMIGVGDKVIYVDSTEPNRIDLLDQ